MPNPFVQQLSSAFLVAAFWAVPASLAGTGAPSPTIDFNRQIRPILSEHCFACHGPDENKRKAGLRLDLQEEATKALKSGERAIVPGNLTNSALVQRVLATDPDDVMPPPKHQKPLSREQIDLLRR